MRIIMKTFILLILTSAAMISSIANSATVTSQVQKMSYSSYAYESGCEGIDDQACNSSYTDDYSNDDLFYTFTATWDDVSSILNITVSDGNNVQFTDGYYYGGFDPYDGYSESESVSINVTNGQITSFNASKDSNDHLYGFYSNINWSYDGNELIRRIYDIYDLYNFIDILRYDVLNTSAIPLPAGVWLFGSALAGLGVLRKKK